MTFTANSPALNQTLRAIPVNSPENDSTPARKTETSSDILKIMYTNIRGIKGKRSSLIEQLNAEQPHLFILTETLLPTDFNVNIEGYTFYGKARMGRYGGGVAVLVRDDICKNIIPHISDRDIEMIWVSYKLKKRPPLFIGCYYGKQETRCSKEEITVEMGNLSEEIQENLNEGEVLIFMDGNGKIGLLGEEKSRNGKLLEEVVTTHNLAFLNKNQKCVGQITRQNTKNTNEVSAIDFVVSTKNVEEKLISLLIDEEGIYKIKGKKETDHNTIISHFQVPTRQKEKAIKKSIWRLNAPATSWRNFDNDLTNLSYKMHQLLSDNNTIDDIYNKWLCKIEGLARKNIGRTTIRNRKCERFSSEVENLRLKKRQIKNKLKHSSIDKNLNINKLKNVQEQLRQQILRERTEKTKNRLSAISQDATRNSFWRERKKLKREPVKENLTVKDTTGARQYSPKMIMDTMANYYENLYKIKPMRSHPIHEQVKAQTQQYLTDTSADKEWYNSMPTERQIMEIIENKKNGKATTDIKNEMLKNAKEGFVNTITPLIKYIWKHEQIPRKWNMGHITSIWKGKGDKESLQNHRGITVSSSISNILEEVIDRRIGAIVEFSQGQAGGKKGASPVDHLFLLRGMMTTAIEKKQNLFLTFFDVSKAYDNADVTYMLHVIWEKGIRGKMWRILNNMSRNLTAMIKTRYGFSRIIKRENGGRQGSRLSGRLFAKQMDVLSESFIENDNLNYPVNEDFSIGCLEYVDDVMTCTLGKKKQDEALQRVDNFAQISKLEWGAEKCQVMQVGRKVKVPETWTLGQKRIRNTTSYKYLGDTITSNGKNKTNIEKRFNTVQSIIRQINTTAASDVMKGVESKVILELYHACIIPSFLNNAESWCLSDSEEKELDKLGIRIIKRLFSLPEKTPSPAVIHSFGLLNTTQQIDQKKFMFLYKILQRPNDHWTKKMLFHLKSQDIGWAKSIQAKLAAYGLEPDWDKIKDHNKSSWKHVVNTAVKEKNKQKLLESCVQLGPDGQRIKTKTAYIYHNVKDNTFNHEALPEIVTSNKVNTKTIILARCGMLECGRNFKGTIPEICRGCGEEDNESHRLNRCKTWKHLNLSETDYKVDFGDIYSDNTQKVMHVIKAIQRVWELHFGNGTMKKTVVN